MVLQGRSGTNNNIVKEDVEKGRWGACALYQGLFLNIFSADILSLLYKCKLNV